MLGWLVFMCQCASDNIRPGDRQPALFSSAQVVCPNTSHRDLMHKGCHWVVYLWGFAVEMLHIGALLPLWSIMLEINYLKVSTNHPTIMSSTWPPQPPTSPHSFIMLTSLTNCVLPLILFFSWFYFPSIMHLPHPYITVSFMSSLSSIGCQTFSTVCHCGGSSLLQLREMHLLNFLSNTLPADSHCHGNEMVRK